MQISAVIQCQRSQQQVIKNSLRLGAFLLGVTTLLATYTARAQSSPKSDIAIIRPLLTQTTRTAATRVTDGIYLFGEKPLPDQLQTAYMIFEAQAGQVIGAFYSPHSSFDCFRGNVQNTQLSLAITESYSQEEYVYALNLEDTAIAGPGGSQFAIEGFHQMDMVSDNDLRMLGTCQNHYSQTI